MPPRQTRTALSSAPEERSTSPVASTSTVPPAEPAKDAPGTSGKKRRKLPACDSCKLRRVLCKPVPPPASCERCRDKGIVCTTTPVVRKRAAGRTGKRIEEARAMFGTADPNAPDFMGASNTPWIQPRLAGAAGAGETLATGVKQPPLSLSEKDQDSQLSFGALDGALVAHLLELYQALPQSWLPIGARGKMSLLFEAAGRRLDALPPQAEVLAHAMIALTSRLSSHPALFAPGAPVPPFDSLSASGDLRQFGQRREDACEKLRRKAVKLAWERGTLVVTSEEAMASCYLLEMLEGRNNPKAGKPYGSAFVSHLRTLLDQADEPGAPKVMNMSLGWSALIMREALYAANAGRTSHFTATDDLLLCGEVPSSIEAALLETVDDVDVRDSVTLFFRPMRPYTYHCARLARECSDHITGTHARRQPLDELYVAKYLTQLDHLLHLFAILESRIAFVLSPAATSAHALPAPFEQERQFIMRACLYTLSLAWAGLSLPVYTDLQRRVEQLEASLAAASDPNDAAGRLPLHSLPSAQRALERLKLLLAQVHVTCLKGARMVAQCVREAPSLAFLTHLQSENLEKWVRVLLEAKGTEDGGEGITGEERRNDLVWMLDGLKTMGWSWSDNAELIRTIEEALGQKPSIVEDIKEGDHQMQVEDASSSGTPFASTSTGLPQPRASTSVAQPPQTSMSTSGFDFASLLGGTSATPSPTSTSVPDLSGLADLFPPSSCASTAPPPPSASSPFVPPPIPTAHPLATPPAPQPPSLDLPSLISSYLAGTLVLPPGLDLEAATSAFFNGTLDVNALAAEFGVGGLNGGMGGGPGAPGGTGTGQGGTQGGGGGSGQEFDFDALLAEPLFQQDQPQGGGGGA
ncbi:hypothetical protein JCM5296_000931 [Sporobolomyces johnsonii]